MTHCHGILIEILWSQNLTEPLVFLLKWHYTLKYLLKTIYYSLFNSHVIYASQIWGQSKSDHFRKLVELQDKTLKFPSWHGSFKRDIHKNSKILKLHDYIALQTTLLIKDFFSEKLPKPLNEHSKKLNQHQHVHTILFLFLKYTPKCTEKVLSSINQRPWNNLNQVLQIDLLQQTKGNAKNVISEHFFNNYWK